MKAVHIHFAVVLALLSLFTFLYSNFVLVVTTSLALKHRQVNDVKEKNVPKTTKSGALVMEYEGSFWAWRYKILLLRPGKSGSGTAMDHLKLWKTKFDYCHPLPCINQTRDAENVFITIRDPVDRFVSSFNWRSLLICKDFNETRKVGRTQAGHPMEICVESKKERKIIHDKYKSNVNSLAMALCKQQQQSSNKNVIEDVKKIVHARHSLSDWLESSKVWQNKDGESKLLPIVLEHGYDFAKQIDDSIRFLLLRKDGDKALEKQENFYQKNIHEQNNNEKTTQMTHSSSSFIPPSVQKMTECCLARYFHLDYKLLQTMSMTSCHNDECKDALESIYMRRSPFLRNLSEDNFDFCSTKPWTST